MRQTNFSLDELMSFVNGKSIKKGGKLMKKMLMVLLGLVLIFGLGFPKTASAFWNEETELNRIQKLADERIKEAERLKIRKKAKEIVECLAGKANFIFTDAESKLMINLGAEIKDTQDFGKISLEITEIFYKRQLVFRSVYNWYWDHGYYDIQVYRPGEWMKKLESLHKKAMSKKEEERKNEIQKKIRDLKEKFGL